MLPGALLVAFDHAVHCTGCQRRPSGKRLRKEEAESDQDAVWTLVVVTNVYAGRQERNFHRKVGCSRHLGESHALPGPL